MLEACRTPELITELTLQPVRRHGVDAAILFSDIVVPLAAVGVGVDIVSGVGPVVEKPMRTMSDVDRLRPLEPSEVPYLSQAVSALVAELGATPLIGFAGAPFTLASYLIEGRPSREHARTKALMQASRRCAFCCQPGWQPSPRPSRVRSTRAPPRCSCSTRGPGRCRLPITSGRASAQPGRPESLTGRGVPRIHFGVGSGELLALMRAAGAEVVGVDWRVPLPEAARRIGTSAVVQGNLDPALLLAEWPVVDAEVRRIVAEGLCDGGHIFNLGHGVLPETDPDVLTRVVALVKELTD
jgi:uroporphyrinogen decarboxylase